MILLRNREYPATSDYASIAYKEMSLPIVGADVANAFFLSEPCVTLGSRKEGIEPGSWGALDLHRSTHFDRKPVEFRWRQSAQEAQRGQAAELLGRIRKGSRHDAERAAAGVVTQHLGGRRSGIQGWDKAPHFALSCPNSCPRPAQRRLRHGRTSKGRDPLNGRTGRCPPFDRRFRSRSGAIDCAQMEGRGDRRRSGGA